MSPASSQPVPSHAPSLGRLVALFAAVGASAFGGSIPAHVLPLCDKRGWLSNRECLEALNWCRSLPGAGGTNLSAYLGYGWHKIRGALLTTLAVVLPGALAILGVSHLLFHLPQPVVHAALMAVVAASIGLQVDLTWRLARPSLTSALRWIIASATFLLVGMLRVPIPWVLVVMVPVAWYLHHQTLNTSPPQ